MNIQTWTLIGIVVGAVLGGAAQIVAGSVQRSFDRARVVQDFRREAYSRFLHVALVVLQERARSASHRYMASLQPRPTPDEEPPSVEDLERAERETNPGFDADFAFQEALLQIEIVAPDDTFRAARRFYKRVTTLSRSLLAVDEDGDESHTAAIASSDASREPAGDGDDASQERKVFVALAKRDVGLSGKATAP